jgi:hypothetical protein
MNDTLAEHIRTLPIDEGFALLASMGAHQDADGVVNIDGYAFFQAFSDSTSLYYEV